MPVADKLIQVTETYGFDGWFINQETEGAEERALTRDDAVKMQEFIKYFKKQAPEMRLVYYDSMTSEGKMDWQNALTDKNTMFMTDEEGNAVADEMFLNFWWTEDELADKDLLKAFGEKTEELGISPYDLYASVDVQAEGYLTPVRWDLFESGENTTNTSLGLYCPSWAYYSAATPDEFRQKEDALWVNSEGDPSEEIQYSSEEQWRGISTYAVEKSALTTLPFVTNFSTGNGYSFFREGEQVSKMDWNNRSVGDILPTYRWMIENEGENSLKADFDVADAWYGGNSVKLYGNMEKGKAFRIQMYSADLPVEEKTVFTTVTKSNTKCFYINTLTRTDDTKQSEFKVVPVNEQAEQGKGASVKTEWPDNSVPKAGLTASQTLVGAGSTVTFASACSEKTPVNARYVKVSVVKPTQGSDSAARIYEIQVYGAEDELK